MFINKYKFIASMNKKILKNGVIVIIITLIILFSGCVKKPDVKTINLDDSGWTSKGVNNITNANNKFAFDFYSQLNKEYKNENIFFSPYSILVALTMTYEGARGETAEEMQSVLHIPKNASLRRQNFARIIKEINKKNKNYELSTANALWVQKDYKLLNEYTNIINKYYGGKTTNLDFIDDEAREKSREIINSWVENQTKNKIQNLIPKGVLNELTRLVLTNAIYFKGKWVLQFDPKNTKNENFTTSTGKVVKVPMMRITGEDAKFNYTETDKAQILEMPYEGKDLSMLIILPKENNLENIEKIITPKKLLEWKNILRKQRVDVFFPKFKFETKYFMVDILKKMGIKSAFSLDADFSGMDGTKYLKVQDVIHEAFIEVNEEGTEAAAATAVVVGLESMPMAPKVFRVDHPFIFIIQQRDTGNILFIGKVNDPTTN